MANGNATLKEVMRAADARLMTDIIKRSRAAYAALPEPAKRWIVQRMEDERAAALAGGAT